jgi:nucleoid-associated protein YgaU
VELRFEGEVVHWRGPAPYLFVPLPPPEAAQVRAVARQVTYGWGVIPVTARIGGTEFDTSLFPRDGGYLLPVKVAVQRAEGVELGDRVAVTMSVARA